MSDENEQVILDILHVRPGLFLTTGMLLSVTLGQPV